MSGNVKEWALAHQPGQNPIRGGASNNTGVGISCALNFTLADDTFFFPNVGFRCCTIDAVDRCPRCLLQQRVCLCAEVPTVATRTRVVIVRHHLERHRSSNSGRLAHLALPNSEIVDHGGARRAGAAAAARRRVAAVSRGRADARALRSRRREQLIVLDATWSQARRMYRKLDRAARAADAAAARRADAGGAAARSRRARAGCRRSRRSRAALRLLEGDAVAQPLETLFALAVERARATGRARSSDTALGR